MDSWSGKDGLPQHRINAITQTPDGFLWLGTNAGLVRFDGTSFTVFDSKNCPSMQYDNITALRVSQDGKLWVAIERNGFGYFNNNVYHRVERYGPGWNYTYYIYEEKDSTLWFGGLLENHLTSYKNGHYQGYKSEPDTITGMARMPDGRYLLGLYDDGFRIIDPTKDKTSPVPFANKIKSKNILNVTQTQDGAIWLASKNDGLYRIINNKVTNYTMRDGLPSNATRVLYVDSQGVLWVGTNNGLAWLNKNRFHSFTKSDGLYDSDVQAIFEDSEGNIWVSAGLGLVRFANTHFIPYELRNGSMLINLGRISPSRDGGIWCATDNGLWRIHKGVINTYEQQPWWPKEQMDRVIEGKDGLIYTWLSHENKCLFKIFDLKNHKQPLIKSFNVPISLNAYCVVQGDQIFISDNDYISIIKNGKYVKRYKTNAGWNFDLYMDKNSDIWIGSGSGLYLLHQGKLVNVRKYFHETMSILQMDVDDPNHIWVTTDKGLARLDRDLSSKEPAYKVHLYGIPEGLPTDKLQGVVRDNNNAIWLSLPTDVYSIQIADFDKLDCGLIKKLPYIKYTAVDGIKCSPYNGIKGKDGEIWFYGAQGIVMIDPRHVRKNTVAPSVALIDPSIDNTRLLPNRTITVKPGKGSLKIPFAALSYSAPEHVRCWYKLIGYSNNWIEAGQNHTATFTNLPPGHYKFQLIACNEDGVWNKKGVWCAFDLQPHFYQTIWFRVLCIITIIICIAAIFQTRARRIMAKNHELEAKVKERTADLTEAYEHLYALKEELEAQNEELEAMQSELEAQNEDLVTTHATLAAANEKLEQLASTDGLTGLKNHRSFQDELHLEFERMKRNNSQISLILLDIDHFKQFNDNFGHPVGDEVLKNVAKILLDNVREYDYVARYGGEEMVIIVPDTDAEMAIILAERLRSAIECAHWVYRQVTASFGVSTTNSPDMPPSHLINEADTALYVSKNKGRNRVTHAYFIDRSQAAA